MPVGAKLFAAASTPDTGVCDRRRVLRIPYHNKADGFMAAVLLALNQVKFCELHACRPLVEWGMFPVCKYEGVRFPGRTPFYEKSVGANAFEYYFEQPCAGPPPQKGPPMLTCEQRELVHRQLPWAVRTYYYGAHDPQPEPGRNETLTYDEEWYGSHRMEAARLVRTYLKLQPHIRTKVEGIASQLLGSAPILGVHLRGTDKGKYLSARSGRPVPPSEYLRYVEAYLKATPAGRVFVATDSPSFLADAKRIFPSDKLILRDEVLRDENNVAFKGRGGGKHNYRKGEEVLIDALLLSRSDWLMQSLAMTKIAAQSIATERHVIICGYGRSGQNLAHMVEQEGIGYVALDLDPDRVRDAAAAGEHVVYGDAARRESLVAAGIHRAAAVAITYADTASALKVSLSNLLGVGVGEMSASQLEAAEDVHRDLLARLTDARVELARRQERARLEEAAAIERTIDQTLAAAGATSRTGISWTRSGLSSRKAEPR